MRRELGNGGAPEDEGERLQFLEDEYKAGAEKLSSIGFNGDVFDIELPRVKKRVFTDDEEKTIEALMEKGVINRAGALNKLGVTVANGATMLEAHRRLEERKRQQAQDKAKNQKMEAMSEVELAIYH